MNQGTALNTAATRKQIFRLCLAAGVFAATLGALVNASSDSAPSTPVASNQTTLLASDSTPTLPPRVVDAFTAAAIEDLLGVWEFVAVENTDDQSMRLNLANGFMRFDSPTTLGPSVSVYRRGGCAAGGGALEIVENVLVVVEEYRIPAIDCPGVGPVPIVKVVYLNLNEGLRYELVDDELRLHPSDNSVAILQRSG